MKHERIYWVVALVGMGLGAAFLTDALAQGRTGPPGADLRVAVCSVGRVMDNYPQVKELNAELTKRQEQMKVEAARQRQIINSIDEELTQLDPNSAEYLNRRKERDQKGFALEAWMKAEEASLMFWHFRQTRQMFQAILRAVEDVAKAQRYHLVLFRERPELQSLNSGSLVEEMSRRKVLYCDEALDITDRVVAQLNLKHRAGKP